MKDDSPQSRWLCPNTRRALILGLAALNLAVFLFHSLGGGTEEKSTDETNHEAALAPRPRSDRPVSASSSARFHRDILGSIEESARRRNSETVFDPERFETDELYRAKIGDHIMIRSYLESPVRESPGCEAVVSLLEEWGYGREAVRDAYNIAWLAGKITDRVQGFDETMPQRWAAESLRDSFIDELSIKRFDLEHGGADPEFIRALKEIRVDEPFGPLRFDLEDGETLYFE